ncbi:MAG: patatin-like phospholipase family protein [Steroidobacteraceae bacterium]|nr:patatin-like phospholipase family protein [Steroidobacteraceae bacterium]
MARLVTCFCCLLIAQAAAAESAAPAETADRPRIGLVLSGGGARGLAHAGVLKVLEEQRVPIDAIAGTSMGAVIGGLYASGMTPAQIETLVGTLDWYEAFRDRSPRRDKNFRRKQDDREFLVRFPLGVKSGDLRVPRGLIQGQKLTQVLRRETIAVAGISDFDRLPTPFRAVATDLETGERRVLAGGDLTEALRASMSAPGVFAPIEVGGRLLVDGGLVENLPVDVAKQMGVDLVIAVDVGFVPVGRKELNSAFAVSNQMLTIMMMRETERQRALLAAGDLLIAPALGTMLSTDFTAVARTIQAGEDAARAQAPRLAALSLDAARWNQYLASRSGAADRPGLQFVRVDERSTRYRERIEAELAPVVGKPLDAQAMERHLSRLYGDDNFETVDYRVVRDGERSGIEVSARRKSWGPNYLRFGLELQDDFEGSNSFNAGLRTLVTEANRYGADLQLDLQVGAHPLFRTQFHQPLGYASRWFVAPRLLIERRLFDIRDGDDRLATYRVRTAEAGLDLGRELGSWGEWRVGVLRGEGKRNLLVGDPGDPDLPPRTGFDRGELFSRFSVDRLDDVHFPRHGELFTLQWDAPRESLGAEADLDRISFDLQVARSRGRNTIVISASGGARVSGDSSGVEDFYSLGGLFNLSGLSPDAVSGPHFGIARAIYYRRIGSGQEGFLNVPTYLGASLERGNVWERRNDMDFGSARTNGALFLGFDTFLGPVYLAAGLDEDGGRSFYLLLGRIR